MQLLKTIPADTQPKPVARPVDMAPPARRVCLNALRITSLVCRTAPRSELTHDCAKLSTQKSVALEAQTEVLMRGLEQGLGRRPVIYRPGVEAVSFDEAWILRAIDMASRERWDSLEFLLRSRLSKTARRPMASLIVAISKQLSIF
ncbi:MAG: hypothetical protein AAF340_09020 [Pseudomonadota bacterium]